MKKQTIIIIAIIMIILAMSIIIAKSLMTNNETIETSNTNLSNKKIGWGIKRNDSHEQPDLGSQNRKVLEENQ